MAIIEVNHVTKEYRLGTLHSVKHTFRDLGARLRGKRVPKPEPFKALDDVDFKVEQGEVVGIIGHNGAGKSTLLKHLARITVPTRGSVVVRGKVAPLIEVGAGLIGDLTGRENIYLNGAILGLSRKEINKKLDEIIAFTELEEFIDTPIKRYSSGMSIRLGFSIASSVEAEILIVDEVLAVGDLAFQRKCFDRMEDLIRRQGRTVLLVSHNIRQVARLCNRVCLLGHGKIVADGVPADICEYFYAQSNKKIVEQKELAGGTSSSIRTSGEVILKTLTLLDKHGQETQELVTGESATIRCVFQVNRPVDNSEVIYGFHTTDFVYIASIGTAHLGQQSNLAIGENVVDCQIDHVPLVPGVYAIRVGVLDQFRREMFYGETLKIFSVRSRDIPVTKIAALGLVNIPANWKFNAVLDVVS